MLVLVINCGSSSLKYQLIQMDTETLIAKGLVERIGIEGSVISHTTIGKEKKVLRAGDGYYVAPNMPHGCVCLEAGVLIDTFSPMREDFLK